MLVLRALVVVVLLDAEPATLILVLRALFVVTIEDIELAILMFVLRALVVVVKLVSEPSRTIPVFKLAELDTIH